MPGCVVDGSNPLAVFAAASDAVDRARNGGGPSFVEIKVYRYLPHTSNDDDKRYRSREQVEQARLSDPVPRFRQYLIEQSLWDEEKDRALRDELQSTVDEALAFAEASPSPSPEDAFLNVYAPAQS